MTYIRASLAPEAAFQDAVGVSKPLTNPLDSTAPETLDHAGEFVGIVMGQAPGVYRQLLASPEVSRLLSVSRSFNNGKVLTWAQFMVFQKEFSQRFPESSREACINAFCALFLKNDISMTNLANVMEPLIGEKAQRLHGRQED